MIYKREYIKELLKKHIQRSASLREEKIFMIALDLYEEEDLAEIAAEIDIASNNCSQAVRTDCLPKAKQIIRRCSIKSGKNLINRIVNNLAAAAVFLIIAGSLIWLIMKPAHIEYSCGSERNKETDFLPGINKCRLTLASGCTIIVDSSYKGKIAREANIEIKKLESGILVYNLSADTNDSTGSFYNTIATSAGAQYRIILSDGSVITLNAGSSVRFPVNFSNNHPVVEVKGEAYFEIKPRTNNITILAGSMVMQTREGNFNINNYFDRTKATLISGMIKINGDTGYMNLSPGQQITLGKKSTPGKETPVSIKNTDIPDAISWQKPVRTYNMIDNHEFISNMARWYDLEIVDIGNAPSGSVSGEFCYSMPLQEILDRMKMVGMRFKREGKRLIFYL